MYNFIIEFEKLKIYICRPIIDFYYKFKKNILNDECGLNNSCKLYMLNSHSNFGIVSSLPIYLKIIVGMEGL